MTLELDGLDAPRPALQWVPGTHCKVSKAEDGMVWFQVFVKRVVGAYHGGVGLLGGPSRGRLGGKGCLAHGYSWVMLLSGGVWQ